MKLTAWKVKVLDESPKLTVRRGPLEAASVVRPPRVHHHVLGVELARGEGAGVRGRPQGVGRRPRDFPVPARRVRPPGLVGSGSEVTAGRGRVLGHAPAARHEDRRLLQVLVEAGAPIGVTAGAATPGMEHPTWCRLGACWALSAAGKEKSLPLRSG